ncbi:MULTISPECIES: MBL fold metallo-hydrolase [unclassified Frankia]|uniref:MBL fold metallo-hydrolase n=1 Tax=unclassified Frankia TaxID=2632575 RepID=UPI001EF3FF11|nr:MULTISPECIES: MBL fold metallo-hydrolase [unclassified Frankia]
MDVTWWGHSTVGIQDAGTRLLTDPVLGMRVAHLRRRAGARPAAQAAQVDAAVVSHLHADHLDIPSLRLLPPAVPILVPRGASALLRHRHPALAERCVEMVPGDQARIPAPDGGGGLDVLAVPARHDGSRGPWSRHRGPALGFVITGTATAWFAGDTALHDAMADLAPLGIDLALVPVGGWGPSLGPGHIDPAGAVEAVRRVIPAGQPVPAMAVPIHYGTLWPIGFDRVRPDRFHEPGREFARLADAAQVPAEVRLPAHGVAVTVPGGTRTGAAPAGTGQDDAGQDSTGQDDAFPVASADKD